MKKKLLIVVIVLFAILAALLLIINSADDDSSKGNQSSSIVPSENEKLELQFGELLSFIDNNEGIAIIKAKIKPSYNNEATINQNYFNIEHLIKDNDFTKYNEIQYWAVADMNDGSESKVVSFTINKDLIDRISNDNIVANELGDYLDDLWIHPSLR